MDLSATTLKLHLEIQAGNTFTVLTEPLIPCWHVQPNVQIQLIESAAGKPVTPGCSTMTLTASQYC